MNSSLRLGRVLGITINLHWTWFIIFALITLSLSFGFGAGNPLWARITIGVITSLLLFASVVAHELAHSLVAIKNGIPVKSITLFVLGGVARITREATHPATELVMAIAGPLSSLVLAGIFYGIWYQLWGDNRFDLDNPIFWLAWINLALALFNLVPGFPLDGGRVLRALLWWRMGNYKRATRIASLVGQGVAYLLIAGGIAIIFLTDLNPFNGIWLAFIGWFLHTAATSSYRQVELREALHGFTAQAVMNTDYLTVPPNLSLMGLVQDYMLPTGRHYFVVVEEGRFRGIITSDNIKAVPQTHWAITPVSAVMTPADKVVSAYPEEEAFSIMEQMEEHGISQIPIVKEGRVIGIVVRENLLRFIRLRSELRI